MKNPKFLLAILIVALNTMSGYSQQSKDLLGSQPLSQLKNFERFPWFEKGYNDYNVDTNLLPNLSQLLKNDIKLIIVSGTWCVDTKRELPKFIKVIEKAGFDESNLSLLFVDTRKVSPEKTEKKLKVKIVPTFIVYMNGIEKGRIIESPNVSIEKDLITLLTK